MSKITIPQGYKPLLDGLTTEKAIRKIKGEFQTNLAYELNLHRASAPLFVLAGTGINDDLNGIERPVQFQIKDMDNATAQIVHSLAKWKRLELALLDIKPGAGIYTDMNAIRADEELDNIHSIYVDQWDWEKVIKPEDRTLETLKDTVKRIYNAILRTEHFVHEEYPVLTPFLPSEIRFIHSEDLEAEYPGLSAKERENEVTKKYGAVFLIGIGKELPLSKAPHDGRAPDYDDWSTPTTPGHFGLNGDLLVWNPMLQNSLELSSMGIRVDKNSMIAQLKIRNATDRLKLKFHTALMNDEVPQTMGGGIGQSRLCMLLLHKVHIGEVQASLWPDNIVKSCNAAGFSLL